MRSKEEFRVFGSTIFEGFHEQNFLTAVESLPDHPEADLDQVWENLKLMYFKPSARRTQMKVMRVLYVEHTMGISTYILKNNK